MEGVFSQFQLKQSDLKVGPKCQMSTCIQNKALTRKTILLNRSQIKPGEVKNAKKAWAQIQEKEVPSKLRIGKKVVSDSVAVVNTKPLLSSPGALRRLLWYRPSNVDLKHFLQEKCVYFGSAENCNSTLHGWVVGKFPTCQNRENTFIEGKRSWESYSKHRISGFSLVFFQAGKKKSLHVEEKVFAPALHSHGLFPLVEMLSTKCNGPASKAYHYSSHCWQEYKTDCLA